MENKNLLIDVPKEQRSQMLQDMATKTSNETVRRSYSEDEKVQMKDFLSEESIQLMDQTEEFKAIKKQFDALMKSRKSAILESLKCIKKGYSEQTEKVFLFDDQEKGVMDIHDCNGEFLYSRKLYADERQVKIFDLHKTGTNG